MKYYAVKRTQKSVGGNRNGFGGGDTYFAVIGIPVSSDFTPSSQLKPSKMAREGVDYRWIGEGYSANQGPRSAYGIAWTRAQLLAVELNVAAAMAESAEKSLA